MPPRKAWHDYPAPERDVETGCLRWMGPHDAQGYGTFGAHGRAHREALIRAGGVIPPGWVVDHVYLRGCRHRDCVEPAHLEAVTRPENTARGPQQTARRDATHCAAGHEYEAGNLMPKSNGARDCLSCNRERQARFKARRRAAG